MKLRAYLLEEELTATEFALRVGLSLSTVTRLANDELRPSMETLDLIHEATDGKVTFADFSRLEGIA